jgi:hypothetical protein
LPNAIFTAKDVWPYFGFIMAKTSRSLSFSVAAYVFDMPIADFEMMIKNGFLVKGDTEGTVLCEFDDKNKVFNLVRAKMKTEESDVP